MNCNQAQIHIHDYIDGYLGEPQNEALKIHLHHCRECNEKVNELTSVKLLLQELPPTPSPDKFLSHRIISARKRNSHKKHKLIWFSSGAGAAIAASLLMWIAGIFDKTSPLLPSIQGDSFAYIRTINTPHTINLVFHSESALNDVRFSIMTPNTVDIDGFQGQRTIAWQWRLKKGENLLAIPVIVRKPSAQEFVLALEHKDEIRKFKVKVNTTQTENESS